MTENIIQKTNWYQTGYLWQKSPEHIVHKTEKNN
jgi:hypothetical protein